MKLYLNRPQINSKKYLYLVWGAGILGLVIITSFLRFNPKPSIDSQPRVAGVKIASVDQSSLKLNNLALPPVKINSSQPTVSANAVYLVDVASAYPVYSYNADKKVPIASITKIMTAIVVLEEYQLDDMVTISQNAATTIGSDIQLQTGEELTIESLLKALLIKSGNDAAVALAEHIGFEKFVAKMNQKAQFLGLSDTQFKDPAGLDDQGYSTARDLGTLSAYAMRDPRFWAITRIAETTIYSANGKLAHKLETSNRLIKPDHPLFLSGANGIKTGFTPEAGHSLVSSATRSGHTLVGVVLNTTDQTTEASAQESRKLLEWGFANHRWN